MKRSLSLSRRTLLASAGASALALSGCDKLNKLINGSPKVSFKGVDVTGTGYGQQFVLPDLAGRPRRISDFSGKVLVVFFGYTQCPDVCPTTLAELAQVKKALGADGERIQGIFVSVDPERDQPAMLKAYVTGFDPSFIALRGNAEQTAAAAKDFKVFFAKVPGQAEGSYTIDHTAGSYLFDAKGQLRVFTRYGAEPDALTADLKQLLSEG